METHIHVTGPFGGEYTAFFVPGGKSCPVPRGYDGTSESAAIAALRAAMPELGDLPITRFAPPPPPTMTRQQATEMAAGIEAAGKFTEVAVRQAAGEWARPDDPWTVEIWSVNSDAGNRNLTVIESYQPAKIRNIAKAATASATARDSAALARIAADLRRELQDD